MSDTDRMGGIIQWCPEGGQGGERRGGTEIELSIFSWTCNLFAWIKRGEKEFWRLGSKTFANSLARHEAKHLRNVFCLKLSFFSFFFFSFVIVVHLKVLFQDFLVPGKFKRAKLAEWKAVFYVFICTVPTFLFNTLKLCLWGGFHFIPEVERKKYWRLPSTRPVRGHWNGILVF